MLLTLQSADVCMYIYIYVNVYIAYITAEQIHAVACACSTVCTFAFIYIYKKALIFRCRPAKQKCQGIQYINIYEMYVHMCVRASSSWASGLVLSLDSAPSWTSPNPHWPNRPKWRMHRKTDGIAAIVVNQILHTLFPVIPPALFKQKPVYTPP